MKNQSSGTFLDMVETSWFVSGMVKATSDMWNKGWDERNGGNVSLRLYDEDVAPYLSGLKSSRRLPLAESLPELAGQYYIATGSGKYFRNVQLDPEGNLGLFRVAPEGNAIDVLWGYRDGAVPTSELPSHLRSHMVSQRRHASQDRVIMHCHATNLIALTYVLKFESANMTRALWEGSTECLVVFPDGVGALPWYVPGTDIIGNRTAELMATFPLVLWQFHGVFGRGSSLDETFGLIDTAEKSAEILTKVIAMGGCRQTIRSDEFVDLAKRFGVVPFAPAVALDGWEMASPEHSRR